MRALGQCLAASGWRLRSGGATGADQAFAAGATLAIPPSAGDSRQEIYIPWKGFSGQDGILATTQQIRAAEALMSRVHPAWAHLTQGARKLHARNVFQILGVNLSEPTTLVICWTRDGAQTAEETSATTGGTGTAIKIASEHGIPVFNLQREDALDQLSEHLAHLGVQLPQGLGNPHEDRQDELQPGQMRLWTRPRG